MLQCLLQHPTVLIEKKLFLISSLILFCFSLCLMSHPPAIHRFEESGSIFLTMFTQAASRSIPKPSFLQAEAAQLLQVLEGKCSHPEHFGGPSLKSLHFAHDLIKISISFVLQFWVPFWLLDFFLGQQEEAETKGCKLVSGLLLVAHFCWGLAGVSLEYRPLGLHENTMFLLYWSDRYQS